MPLKLGLPSTRAGRDVCAWPDVCVIDAETMAPTGPAAMATVMIEPKYRPRMVVSLFCLCFTLLQRISFDTYKIRGIVFGRRMWTSTLREGELFRARSPHQPRETIVSFDAARLVI